MGRRVWFLGIGVLMASVSPIGSPPPAEPSLPRRLANLEVAFEPNVGQAPAEVQFRAWGPGFGVSLARTEAVLHIGRDGVRMRPVGANPAPSLEATDPLGGRVNFLHSADPSQWRTDVPTYGSVTYQDVYPGIDLAYHGKRGALEYDVILAPGADPSTVKLALTGSNGVRLGRDGNLSIGLPGGGTLVQHRPVAYQDDNAGHRRAVDARFTVNGNDEIGFTTGRYDRSRPLVIDPVLTFLTYLGVALDVGNAIVSDEAGNTYVNGTTLGSGFPTVNPIQAHGGYQDAFVTKFNRHGSIVFSTYLGGSSDETGYGIGVDSTGAVYVTGSTKSTDFPVRNAVQPSPRGVSEEIADAYLAKLSPAGNELLWSTYLGGAGDDQGAALAVDPSGNAYIAVITESTDLVTKAPVQPASGGDEEGFIAKYTTGGQVAWATYLGGTGEDEPYGIAADGTGAVFVSGETTSADFPRTNPMQATYGGNADAFVTKYRPNGDTVAYAWSTYLGGPGHDLSYDLDIDDAGAVYVTGGGGPDFPLLNPINTTERGVFVSKLRPDGSGLMYSTFLGGSRGEVGTGIGVDGSGAAYIGGETISGDFPAVNAFAPFGAASQPFIVKLNPPGSAIVYSSSLGGDSFGFAHAVDADRAGNAYVTGRGSPGMPTTSAVDPTTQFSTGFVAKIAAAVPNVLVVGFTWFNDGASSKSAASGTVTRAYATGAKADTSYELVVGRAGAEQPCIVDSVAINGSNRRAGASGLIGNTAGPVNRPPGNYQVCFRQVDGTAITAPVALTIT